MPHNMVELTEVGEMNKQEEVISYKTSVSIFKKWLREGVITADDYSVIETKIAEKYSLSSGSIYRENNLKYSQKSL